MAILHTVNTSPLQTHALQQCLNMLTEGDCLLLIEDAVIAVHAKHALFEALNELAKCGRLMVLSEDLQARALNNNIGQQCTYSDFVVLVTAHQSQMAW